jgi:acyl carrier protein
VTEYLNADSLCKIVAFALNVEESKVNIGTKQSDLDEWDSFGQIAIISSTEAKYGISFLTEEIFSFHTVNDLLHLAKKKIQPES